MWYAVSIAILSILPGTSSGVLWGDRSLESRGGISAPSPHRYHQNFGDEEQLLMIQQQLARAWVQRVGAPLGK
jgi:hypothetical protein